MEGGGQWSQPVLVANWPRQIPPIDLPIAIKAQLQEEELLSPHKVHTLSSPLVLDRGGCAAGTYKTPTTVDHATHTESHNSYLMHRNKHREAAKMKRQRNNAQMKERIKTPEKELNKMEISNLSDAEFKTLVITMLKVLSKGLRNIKKIQNKGYTH